MKRVSSPVSYGRRRERRPDLSKNVSEQLQPMYGGQLANTCKHVFELEGFSKKSVSRGGEARFAHLRVGVRTHDQNSRQRQMALDVFQQPEATGRGSFVRGHL